MPFDLTLVYIHPKFDNKNIVPMKTNMLKINILETKILPAP
ncbi:protein of unknown function [Acetoanaerobium sticklandii]|uniref:Uncharacterized protein n=1 Tax=Acetoanaerobium sticklandii (strain ATCC 12662 / DSM 519 / JCM 1433 / CCUG 9281 / NCIMB 10654 / HF) TaxID=499177 RepID=E3PV07_ACESD|nr:protein of unknown function [Acetoanaerobium sticklandii]